MVLEDIRSRSEGGRGDAGGGGDAGGVCSETSSGVDIVGEVTSDETCMQSSSTQDVVMRSQAQRMRCMVRSVLGMFHYGTDRWQFHIHADFVLHIISATLEKWSGKIYHGVPCDLFPVPSICTAISDRPLPSYIS